VIIEGSAREWIASDPTLHRNDSARALRSSVRDASGDDRTVTVDGKTHTFEVFSVFFLLGQRRANDDAENQVLAACLGAHVNSARCPCAISIRGPGVRVDPVSRSSSLFREGSILRSSEWRRRSHDLRLRRRICSTRSGDDSRVLHPAGGCRFGRWSRSVFTALPN